MVSNLVGMALGMWSVWFLACGQSRGQYGSWYVVGKVVGMVLGMRSVM